jgi:hypothetical protein
LGAPLSSKQMADAFYPNWDKVFDAVEQVATWGLEHQRLVERSAKLVAPIKRSMSSQRYHQWMTMSPPRLTPKAY